MKNLDPKNTNLQFDQHDESKEGNDQTEQTDDKDQSDGETKMSNQVTILVKSYMCIVQILLLIINNYICSPSYILLRKVFSCLFEIALLIYALGFTHTNDC